MCTLLLLAQSSTPPAAALRSPLTRRLSPSLQSSAFCAVVLNEEVFLELTLHNTSSSLCTFKVKTTARDRYLLRPTQDYIPPHGSRQCKIVMAAMRAYPDLSNPKNLVRTHTATRSASKAAPRPTQQQQLIDVESHLAVSCVPLLGCCCRHYRRTSSWCRQPTSTQKCLISRNSYEHTERRRGATGGGDTDPFLSSALQLGH